MSRQARILGCCWTPHPSLPFKCYVKQFSLQEQQNGVGPASWYLLKLGYSIWCPYPPPTDKQPVTNLCQPSKPPRQQTVVVFGPWTIQYKNVLQSMYNLQYEPGGQIEFWEPPDKLFICGGGLDIKWNSPFSVISLEPGPFAGNKAWNDILTQYSGKNIASQHHLSTRTVPGAVPRTNSFQEAFRSKFEL